MPSYYCTVLRDNVISEGKHSQEKLHGRDRTLSKTWKGQGEDYDDTEKRNYVSENPDDVGPIPTHSLPAPSTKKQQ